MADKSVRFNTSISTVINKKMNEHAEITGLTKSAIVTQALADYFQKNELMNNGVELILKMMESNPGLMKSITDSKKK